MKATIVREIMRPAVWVETIDSLEDVAQRMRDTGTRHLAVLHDGKVVGIVSERDVLEYRVALGIEEPWRDVGVSGVMTRALRAASPDDGVAQVASRLASGQIGALPVIDDGVLAGIVTVADVLAAETPPEARRASTAADAMTAGPFTTTPHEILLDATKRMSTHGIRHLPVVDESDHVVGMLSERDVRTAVGDPERFLLAGARVALRVRDAMSSSPVTVSEDRPIADLARIFQDVHMGALPVIDRAEHLVGVVSYVDVLRVLAAPQPGP